MAVVGRFGLSEERSGRDGQGKAGPPSLNKDVHGSVQIERMD